MTLAERPSGSEGNGAAIRAKREALGWSQAKLAELAGTSQQTIDRIERGATEHSRAIPRVMDALGIEFAPPTIAPAEKITLTITVSPRMAKRILALLEDE